MTAELTCPKCHGAMRSYERNTVTVEQCGDCRGIFLDRGELERLVDAEAAYHGAAATSRDAHDRTPYRQDRYRDDDDDRYASRSSGLGGLGGFGGSRKRRKGSFLEELFD